MRPAGAIFTDHLTGEPIHCFIDHLVHDRDRVIALVASHGGQVIDTPSAARVVLVDAQSLASHSFVRDALKNAACIVLDVHWVTRSIEHRQLLGARDNWGGCRLSLGAPVSPRCSTHDPVAAQPYPIPVQQHSAQHVQDPYVFDNTRQQPWTDPQPDLIPVPLVDAQHTRHSHWHHPDPARDSASHSGPSFPSDSFHSLHAHYPDHSHTHMYHSPQHNADYYASEPAYPDPPQAPPPASQWHPAPTAQQHTTSYFAHDQYSSRTHQDQHQHEQPGHHMSASRSTAVDGAFQGPYQRRLDTVVSDESGYSAPAQVSLADEYHTTQASIAPEDGTAPHYSHQQSDEHQHIDRRPSLHDPAVEQQSVEHDLRYGQTAFDGQNVPASDVAASYKPHSELEGPSPDDYVRKAYHQPFLHIQPQPPNADQQFHYEPHGEVSQVHTYYPPAPPPTGVAGPSTNGLALQEFGEQTFVRQRGPNGHLAPHDEFDDQYDGEYDQPYDGSPDDGDDDPQYDSASPTVHVQHPHHLSHMQYSGQGLTDYIEAPETPEYSPPEQPHSHPQPSPGQPQEYEPGYHPRHDDATHYGAPTEYDQRPTTGETMTSVSSVAFVSTAVEGLHGPVLGLHSAITQIYPIVDSAAPPSNAAEQVAKEVEITATQEQPTETRGKKRKRGVTRKSDQDSAPAKLTAPKNGADRLASPEPPVDLAPIKSVFGGYQFTAADVDYLHRYVQHCHDQGLPLSIKEICERVSKKMPHHSFYSWSRFCNKNNITGLPYSMNVSSTESSRDASEGVASADCDDTNDSSSSRIGDGGRSLGSPLQLRSPPPSYRTSAGPQTPPGPLEIPDHRHRDQADGGQAEEPSSFNAEESHEVQTARLETPISPVRPVDPQSRKGRHRANSRSPSPPRELLPSTTGKGVAFTQADVTWLLRFISHRLRKHKPASEPPFNWASFWQDVAVKAPHHSRQSWMKWWRRHKHDFDPRLTGAEADDVELAENPSAAGTLMEPAVAPMLIGYSRPRKKKRYNQDDDMLLARWFAEERDGTTDEQYREFARAPAHAHHPWKGWQEHHRLHKAKIDRLMLGFGLLASSQPDRNFDDDAMCNASEQAGPDHSRAYVTPPASA